ncbi:MAG: O-antigen ligase family protein [Myxococcota bacterium]|nr:O-antigen ligase family protein [Myxococcota bacterium]
MKGGRDRITAGLVALAAAVAIFALGSAQRWGQAVVGGVVALAVLSQLTSRRGLIERSPLMLGIGGALAVTVLQLVPLPDALITSLSETLDGYRRDGAAVAGVDVASTITMDVPGTLRAAAFFATLLGLAWVSLRLAASERGRYFLTASIAGLAALAALVTGIHVLVGATSLYGLYEPRHASPPILGPLLNSNHLGNLMAIGTVTSMGLFLHPKQPNSRRIVWAVAAVGCLVATLASMSRGAVIAVSAGFVVTVGTYVAQRLSTHPSGSRRRGEGFYTRTVPIAIFVLCCLSIAVYMSAGSMMQQLESTKLDELHDPHSKYAAWRSATILVEESPWVGVGRGAFEPAFTRVHPASSVVTFSHAENEGLQAIVDWGIPACIVLALLAGWALLLAIRRWNDGPLAAGALGALMVVAFQSNFDFGIELLGVAAPVVVLFATLTYHPLREVRRVPATYGARLALALAIVGGGVVLLSDRTRTIDDDHEALAEPNVPRETVRAAIERHPLDYYAYAQLAGSYIRADDPHGVRLLNHAMRLHPTHAGLHRIAARLLVRAGRLSQAESEYAAAMRGSRDVRAILTEAAATLPVANAASAIPTELDIDTVTRILIREDKIDLALAWLERVLAVRGDLHTSEVLSQLALEHGKLGPAERAARRRCQFLPSQQCRLALAKILVKAKDHAAVVVQLQDISDWSGHHDDKIAAWLMLCDAYTAVGNMSEARFCVRRLDATGLLPAGDGEIQRRLDALRESKPSEN